MLLFGLYHTTSVKDDCANFGDDSYTVQSDIFDFQTKKTSIYVTDKMRKHSLFLGRMADSPDAHVNLIRTISPVCKASGCDTVLDAARCYQKNGEICISGTALLKEKGDDIVFDFVRLMCEFASHSQNVNC